MDKTGVFTPVWMPKSSADWASEWHLVVSSSKGYFIVFKMFLFTAVIFVIFSASLKFYFELQRKVNKTTSLSVYLIVCISKLSLFNSCFPWLSFALLLFLFCHDSGGRAKHQWALKLMRAVVLLGTQRLQLFIRVLFICFLDIQA